MARKGNPISVRLDLNHSSDSSRFIFILKKRVWGVVRVFFINLFINLVLLFIYPLLWDWGWGAATALFVSVWELVDLVLSAMDEAPLSIGGGGSGVGPSNLPDLNFPPEPEEEPAPAAPSEEALKRAKEGIYADFREHLRSVFFDLPKVRSNKGGGGPSSLAFREAGKLNRGSFFVRNKVAVGEPVAGLNHFFRG